MEDGIWEMFSQFGIAGLILGVLFAVILLNNKAIQKISDDQKESAAAWRQSFEAYADRADERAKETNTVLRDLTRIMTK